MANSTPEAETVALHTGLKNAMLPSLDLYDTLFPTGYQKIIHEDNTGAIQIAVTGKNRTMRWLSRNHGVSIQFLHDKLGKTDRVEDICLTYTRSEWMGADIYTKFFASRDKWRHALELINICRLDEIEGVIQKRSVIYSKMQKDMQLHPNNVRPHKASEATARFYVKPGASGAGQKGCEDAQRMVFAKNRGLVEDVPDGR